VTAGVRRGGVKERTVQEKKNIKKKVKIEGGKSKGEG